MISPFKEIMKKDKHDHFLKNPFFKPSLALEDGVKIGLKTLVVCSTAIHPKAEKRRTPFFRTLFMAFWKALTDELFHIKNNYQGYYGGWNFGMPDEYFRTSKFCSLFFLVPGSI